MRLPLRNNLTLEDNLQNTLRSVPTLVIQSALFPSIAASRDKTRTGVVAHPSSPTEHNTRYPSSSCDRLRNA